MGNSIAIEVEATFRTEMEIPDDNAKAELRTRATKMQLRLTSFLQTLPQMWQKYFLDTNENEQTRLKQCLSLF